MLVADCAVVDLALLTGILLGVEIIPDFARSALDAVNCAPVGFALIDYDRDPSITAFQGVAEEGILTYCANPVFSGRGRGTR